MRLAHALLVSVMLATLGTTASARPYPEAELASALAGRAPGAPVDCVEQSRVQGPEIIDIRTILYRQSGRRIWVNTLADACPSLQPDRILIVEVQGGRMCRGDLFRTLTRNSSIPGPICRLGKFVPWGRPTKTRE